MKPPLSSKRSLTALAVMGLALTGCTSTDTTQPPPVPVSTGVDAESWVLVPAGEFGMGQFEEETDIPADYEIMATPVTNSQYARYLNEALAAGTIRVVDDEVVGHYPGDEFHGGRHEEKIEAGDKLHVPLSESNLRLTFDGKTFRVKDGYEDHPMVFVTWFGAKAYCDATGSRLPTEAEWEKAARGTDGRPFPWGDEIDHENANYYHSDDPFEGEPGAIGDTTPVGFYNGKTYDGFETAASTSPYGAYDMAGNVWQWTADTYEEIHYRYLRGGSKADYGYNLRVWTRNSARPDYASPNAGFRCVRSAG